MRKKDLLRNKAIDHYKKDAAPVLSVQKIMEKIGLVLEAESRELGVSEVYDRLLKHPEQYGLEAVYQLPLLPEFMAICKGRFPYRRVGGDIFIRSVKALWNVAK